VKKCEFIEFDGKNYVPRPNGWIMGMGRYQWFKRVADIETCIAGPEYWEKLGKQGNRKVLVVYDDGNWEVVDESR
tara:strand:+ start:220 stop:444 length:225 start_codon:yes stop_codon:yes gene_type:complete